LLLAAPGIDVNKANNDGGTPLYSASWLFRAEVVKLLLAAPGIDVNKASKYGGTPLYMASREGRAEVVKLLLAAPGIDVNQANYDGFAPLYAASMNGHAEVVKLLLRKPGIETSFELDAFCTFQVVDTGLELNTADVINYTEPLTSPVRCLPCRCVFNFAGLHEWTTQNNTCPKCRSIIENVELMSESAVTRWNAMKSLYEKAEEEEKRAKWLIAHAKTLLEASKAKQSENAFSNRFKTKLRLKF
jgi:ankyrin repeat protein